MSQQHHPFIFSKPIQVVPWLFNPKSVVRCQNYQKIITRLTLATNIENSIWISVAYSVVGKRCCSAVVSVAARLFLLKRSGWLQANEKITCLYDRES